MNSPTYTDRLRTAHTVAAELERHMIDLANAYPAADVWGILADASRVKSALELRLRQNLLRNSFAPRPPVATDRPADG